MRASRLQAAQVVCTGILPASKAILPRSTRINAGLRAIASQQSELGF
jgi:hypothetical protein